MTLPLPRNGQPDYCSLERVILLSRLLVASLCLPTCGCLWWAAQEAITQPVSHALTHPEHGMSDSEAIKHCEKMHHDVPDECRKGDQECEEKVDDFNKCVDNLVKKEE